MESSPRDAESRAALPRFSLIIPVYKNEGSIPELLAACAVLCGEVAGALEVVFVVDGSPDRCWELLRAALPTQPFASQLCLHSRNFGSFAAIRTGLGVARGRVMAVMAADLQEPTSLARDFFRRLDAGEADVAVGVREGRSDPVLSGLSSRLFWWVYRKWVLPEIPPGGVDMFGCTRQVAERLLELPERNSSLVGQLFWVGFKRIEVPYVRQERRHGASAWSFSKKVKYLLDSVYAFSDLPIRALKWLGGTSAAVGAVVSVIVLVARLLGKIEVPGYTPIVLSVTVFGGLNAFGLGLIGEYVWRTFENTKGRPLAITASRHDYPGSRGVS